MQLALFENFDLHIDIDFTDDLHLETEENE